MKHLLFGCVAACMAALVGRAQNQPFPISKSIQGRENIEWSQAYSYHNTDQFRALPRVLLVGDSICNEYQRDVMAALEGQVNVSYWISSYSIVRPEYSRMLDIYLQTHDYAVVHFNNGLHGCGDLAKYEAGIERALRRIRELQPKAKLIWVPSTPLKKGGNVADLNAAAMRAVKRVGVDGIDDLYALMNPLDREANWSDQCHHKPAARKLLAAQVVKSIHAAMDRDNLSAKHVKEALSPWIDRGEISGIVSVLSDPNDHLSVDCLGWADIENKVPISLDTVFAIFSMSKTVCGAALMVAVDKSILKLEDPVSKYLPEFSSISNNVTIHDCMCHITGIDGGSTEMIKRAVPLREAARTMAEKGKITAPVGARFRYCNTGIDVAGACLEVAAKMPYDKFLRENIFKPLGMNDTCFEPRPDMVARMVKAYTTTGGIVRAAADSCAKQIVFPVDHKVYPAPCAGLFSTPRDFIRFSQMLAGHGERQGVRIISRKTFDTIFAVKQTPSNIENLYTVGSWLYGDWFGHEGAMRTDQRANLKTGHARLFFIQTENKAGKAFFDAKKAWHKAADAEQGTTPPFEAKN